MNKQTPNDPPEPSLSEVHHEAMVELTVSMNNMVRKWGGKDRGGKWSKLAQTSDRLSLRNRKNPWTSQDQKLWDQLLDACWRLEAESLGATGLSIKATKRLIRREWATWDSASGRFVTVAERPCQDIAVPVVMVHREADFKIHDDVLYHLWDHPLLADEIASTEGRDSHTVFTGTLERVESIGREHRLDDWEHIQLIAEQDGPDRAGASCVLAALDVQVALESGGSGGGDLFIDESGLPETEDLAWLTDAKRGMHLWRLLNAAVELGKNLEFYDTFRTSRIKEEVRRILEAIPGKAVSTEGKAVERIIKSFREEKGDKPTPLKVLKWLGGERPVSDGEPLKVEHSLWDDSLEGVSWDRFENLVKGARRRSKAVGPSSD